MGFSRRLKLYLVPLLVVGFCAAGAAQSSPKSSSAKPSSLGSHAQKSAGDDSGMDAGSVVNGVYSNKELGLTYKIPAGWVLRTDEMNARDEAERKNSESSPQGTQRGTGESRVLLAAFSRPPEATGEDVNASVVIAAESVEAYPGLKEAAQYFGPLTEVATAQGFTVDEEPYEAEVGGKKLVQGDFHKDVGTRVMRQSTLAWLARGYAVSITVIGGSEDEVEGLIEGVMFTK
ncbi:MAG TPA: hypothetical protein VKQ11_20590 [Candidatus Sulfotelmatobacter sp.]|nr:hypothetical protein [Candidatus Sulfotelmatobacter sp.]